MVSERARQVVCRDDPETDFIGHKDNRPGEGGESGGQRRGLVFYVAGQRHQVAEPQGQAVHQHS